MKLLLRVKALGYVSEGEAARCLDELARSEREGRPIRLAQLLLQRNLINSNEILVALRGQTPVTGNAAVSSRAGANESAVLDALAAGAARTGVKAGERLGGYELVREVARGGMGILFEARQRGGKANQRFALKVLSSRASASAQLLQRFRQEAALAASLDHPNVIKVHEVSQDRGIHFLVMDFFDGRSLADLLREGKLSPKKAIEVVAIVARAASYMHSQKVVHRDLKPGNILVGRGGNVCITDFGLAKDQARQDTTLTQMGVALGTPAYMAPEQARGDLPSVGPASDVYSLGATLYRALSGSYPHDADSFLAAVQKIAREEPIPIQRVRPDVPPELATIVSRAMARDPKARPNALQLADALDRFLAKGPLLMPPAPPNPKV